MIRISLYLFMKNGFMVFEKSTYEDQLFEKTDLEYKKNGRQIIISAPTPQQRTNNSSKNNIKEEFSDKEVNGNFLILDGLQYKSNDEYNPIIYMKV